MKTQLKNRALSALLTTVIFTASFPLTAWAAENPFTDLDESNPSYNAILQLYENDIISGISDTQFGPDAPLTRGMFVTLLGRIAESAGLEVTEVESVSFEDVDPSIWYGKYVDWAYKKGIVSGMSDTEFAPEASVTREQAAAITIRFSQVTHLTLAADGPALSAMNDGSQVSQWFTEQMSAATASGLAIGAESGTLSPQSPATRAETASLLYTLKTRYVGDRLNLTEVLNQYVPIIAGLPVNSYDDTLFTTDENGFRSYNNGNVSTITGIDVSKYQGDIDWQKVKNAGVEFAIIRVGARGYGSEGNLTEDEYFDKNMAAAAEAGVKTGVYFFSQAITAEEAKEEAAFVLDRIRNYSVAYPVVFDWEVVSHAEARTNGISNEALTDCAVAFLEDIEAAGFTPMVYANRSLALLKFDLVRLQKYPFWLASYSDLPQYYYDFQMWQYTDSGSVNGINGNVDMNMSFVDYGTK